MTTKSTPTHVHLETFGCQMNEYDSELVCSLMKQDGFVFTDERERADVILMNTCAIRENAHNKVYKHLSELKKLKQQRPLVVSSSFRFCAIQPRTPTTNGRCCLSFFSSDKCL